MMMAELFVAPKCQFDGWMPEPRKYFLCDKEGTKRVHAMDGEGLMRDFWLCRDHSIYVEVWEAKHE